ncbi:MAG: hypothetical protein NVS4B8_03130 [Herpetosiphon sp.]
MLFAISNQTARDILAYYPTVEPNKIVVTHLAADDFLTTTFAGLQAHVGKPYFLYVGHRVRYKNFLRLLAAFGEANIAAEFNLRVITPGFPVWSEAEQALIQRYQIQAAVTLETGVSDAELAVAYRGAVAFVYPSEYEGFGIPVLEAMECGTIVATSNTGSMPEVGGDAAIYFDPNSVDEIAGCLVNLSTLAASDRQGRILKGLAHAKTFTWEKCQQTTVAQFKMLAT